MIVFSSFYNIAALARQAFKIKKKKLECISSIELKYICHEQKYYFCRTEPSLKCVSKCCHCSLIRYHQITWVYLNLDQFSYSPRINLQLDDGSSGCLHNKFHKQSNVPQSFPCFMVPTNLFYKLANQRARIQLTGTPPRKVEHDQMYHRSVKLVIKFEILFTLLLHMYLQLRK